MDRRSFLGLLGVGAAVVATPEPVRSYFFGPWAPRESGIVVGTAEYGWDPAWAREMVDNRILPASDFIPSIWNEDVLAAIQSRMSVEAFFEYQNTLYAKTQSGVVYGRKDETGLWLTSGDVVPPAVERAFGANPNYRYSEIPPSIVYPRWERGELVDVKLKP